jgi:AcrR family transcriptional regulator
MMAQRDDRGNTAGTLLDRRAAQTRAEIFDAAIELFLAEGFDDTSMTRVADAAGVSRRTLYRYFDTKDDIVFELPRQWLEVLNATIADRRDDEPTRDLVHRALRETAVHLERTRHDVLRGYAVLASSPSLVSRHGRSDAEWVARYLELMGPDVAGLEHEALLATTAAMALVAAQNAAIAVWAAQQPDADLLEMLAVVLEQVDSLWPDPCRHAPDRPEGPRPRPRR